MIVLNHTKIINYSLCVYHLCLCQDGWVGFRKIVLAKPMTASSFYNGYLQKAENAGVIFKSLPNDLDKYTFRTSTARIQVAAS